MKKVLSLLIVLTVVLTTSPHLNIQANTTTTETDQIIDLGGAEYTKSAHILWYSCTFHIVINTINLTQNTFTGSFYYDGELNNSQTINGTYTDQHFSFHVSLGWGGNFSLDLNDSEGTLYGSNTLEPIVGVNETYYGQPYALRNAIQNQQGHTNLDEDLYILCRDASAKVYKKNKKDSDKNHYPKSLYKEFTNNKYQNIEYYNFNDDSDDNVSYIIGHKSTSVCERVFVVIRGSDGIEWEGNMKICPPDNNGNYDTYTFNENDDQTHYNFKTAANGIVAAIQSYLDENNIDMENANVIITGHSRGGAIANLAAKELTDNESFTSSVCAYTFATPNVTPNNENNTLENYNNIFNFCKILDLVPYIPLTNHSWDYWKYGKTYIEIYDENYVYCNELADIMAKTEYAPTVEEYYNKKFSKKNNKNKRISLYNFMQDTLATPMSKGAKNIFKSRKLMNDYGKEYKNISEFSKYFSKNILELSNHQPSKYKNMELNEFVLFTYSDAINRCKTGGTTTQSNRSIIIPNSTSIRNTNFLKQLEKTRSFTESQSIRQFLLCEDENEVSNISKLGWDIDDTSTWTGVTFNDLGNISRIDLPFKDLYGTLNLSNFSDLEYVDVSANWIDNIYLLNDASLTYLDVSDNELSSCIVNTNTALETLDCSFNNILSLNISGNTALTELKCSNCGLSALDISNLTSLEVLDCAFNNLDTINLSSNTALLKLYCEMNYMDLNDTVLTNSFDVVSSRSESEVVFEPQYLPHNAVFDTNELNAIQAIGTANPDLEILSNGSINLEKMQEYFSFEKYNSVYYVDKIYLEDESISGTLDCSAFTKLKEIYCDNTDITSLNLSACTEIEIVSCSNAELSVLTLPTNITQSSSELYDLECENNHLDINIITNSVVANIESKENAELNYRHQRINAPLQAFDVNDYGALTNLYNQYGNSDILEWDLDEPGYFDEIDWKYDTTSQKYKMIACDFSLKKIQGNCDFSNSQELSDFSFLGTYINTVELPGANIPDYAFYDCKRLEAVNLSDSSVSIGELAFYNDNALQGVYIPNTVVSIADNAFEDCGSLTIAGVSNSYAETYSQTNNLPFEAGYFVCGNVVVKETSEGGHDGNYPVEGASVSDGSNSALTDKYGYFVSFGLNNGSHSLYLTYPYGWDLDIAASISNSSMVVTTAIPMVICDYNTDNFINGRDYACFKTANVTSGDSNFKYYDINKDGVKNNADWQVVWDLLGEERPSVQQEPPMRAPLRVSPRKQYKSNTEHHGIEIVEGIDDD